MAKAMYVGDPSGISRKIPKCYVGDESGISRKIKRGYVGDANGIARLIFEEKVIDNPDTDFDLSILQDFEYIANSDGTYTLTAWKGTLNGEDSTIMVTPDHKSVIVEV